MAWRVHPGRNRHRFRPWHIEQLEQRRLLSASSAADRPLGTTPRETTDPTISSFSSFPEGGLLSYDQAFNLQSKPGSNFTIYIDFDGHVTEGTLWNTGYNRPTIVSPPFDLDGDPTGFGQLELERILIAWQRTAEDFAPFDINVTTRDPGLDALTRSGPGDTTWGARAVVTDDTFANCGCGGHAYIGSFNDSTDTPTFIYNQGEGSLGETISHEVGHMVYLFHDGTSAGGLEYYRGHGTGQTAWGPIMGAPFDQNVTTWNNGDYFDANNFENDLNIITTQNGFTYRADDYGNSIAATGALEVAAGGAEVGAFGFIERNTDRDFLAFDTGSGPVSFSISPLSHRPNLDLWAGVYNSAGALVAQSNPSEVLSASFDNLVLSAGTYYLRVEGIGSHDIYNPATDTIDPPPLPLPWKVNPPVGYSDYGSMGQYTVSGTIVVAGGNTFSIVATDAVKTEGASGQDPFTFTVTRSGNTSLAASVDFAVTPTLPAMVGDSYPSPADAADFAPGTLFNGTVSFASGEVSKTLTFNVLGDGELERDEFFDVKLSNASTGWRFADSRATGTILSDESLFGVAPIAASDSVYEGPFEGTLLRWRQVSNASGAFDEWALDNVSLTNSSFADDFDPNIDPANWSEISNGTANSRFGGSGNSLFLSGGADRWATSRLLTAQPGDVLQFDIIFGNGTNGGENADPGEDVVLEYSLDNGSNWTPINVYDTEDFTTWTTIQETLPDPIDDRPRGSMRFLVTRGGGSSLPATVDWQVETAGLSAPADGADFPGGLLPSGQLSFAAGEATLEIAIEVAGDTDVEPNEQFTLRLTAAGGAGSPAVDPDHDSASGTILNDDLPPSGDFNGDGRWDCLDVDDLVANIAGQTGNLTYDVNGDGLVDTDDLDAWLAVAGSINLPSGNPYLRGDATLDGFVDGVDFTRWNANKFTADVGWCGGDFNADGFADGQDFTLWNQHKFTGSNPTPARAERSEARGQPSPSILTIPRTQPFSASFGFQNPSSRVSAARRAIDTLFAELGNEDDEIAPKHVPVAADGVLSSRW